MIAAKTGKGGELCWRREELEKKGLSFPLLIQKKSPNSWEFDACGFEEYWNLKYIGRCGSDLAAVHSLGWRDRKGLLKYWQLKEQNSWATATTYKHVKVKYF